MINSAGITGADEGGIARPLFRRRREIADSLDVVFAIVFDEDTTLRAGVLAVQLLLCTTNFSGRKRRPQFAH